jgi:hypothetical protein
MNRRLAGFKEFISRLVYYASSIGEVIGLLLLLIVLGGCAIAWLEGVKLGDSIYFAFITGLSIGYGDITPKTELGRVVSVAIGLIGMLFVGCTVAVATRALRDTIEHRKKTEGQSAR